MLLKARPSLRVEVYVEPGDAWISAITPEAVQMMANAIVSAFFIVLG